MLREFYFWILSLGGCVVKYVVLDRRQAVRHWVLVPAFAGSNPAGPAIENTQPFGWVFSIVGLAG